MSNEDWFQNAVLASGRAHINVGADFGWFGSKLVKSVAHVVSAPVKAVVHVASAPVKLAGNATSALSKQISKVPVIGKGLHAVYAINSAPISFASSVASGQRIDKAVYNHLKEQGKSLQDVAPYAQTVVSFVPGVGQGVAGAIGAANALSHGRSITDAVIEGARGALPGGPVAIAAFDVATAAVKGQPISDVALAAIPLPKEQKIYVIQAVHAAADIAQGKKIDEAIYNRGKALLPVAAQKALDTGIALAHGQKLQQIAMQQAPTAAGQLLALGQSLAAHDSYIQAATHVLDPKTAMGYLKGVGFVQHSVTPAELSAVRNALPPEETKGFDMAVSAHIGKVAGITMPKVNAAYDALRAHLGFLTTIGMQGAKDKHKVAMMTELIKDPSMKAGANIAIQTLHPSFWQRVKQFLHLGV